MLYPRTHLPRLMSYNSVQNPPGCYQWRHSNLWRSCASVCRSCTKAALRTISPHRSYTMWLGSASCISYNLHNIYRVAQSTGCNCSWSRLCFLQATVKKSFSLWNRGLITLHHPSRLGPLNRSLVFFSAILFLLSNFCLHKCQYTCQYSVCILKFHFFFHLYCVLSINTEYKETLNRINLRICLNSVSFQYILALNMSQ